MEVCNEEINYCIICYVFPGSAVFAGAWIGGSRKEKIHSASRNTDALNTYYYKGCHGYGTAGRRTE